MVIYTGLFANISSFDSIAVDPATKDIYASMKYYYDTLGLYITSVFYISYIDGSIKSRYNFRAYMFENGKPDYIAVTTTSTVVVGF